MDPTIFLLASGQSTTANFESQAKRLIETSEANIARIDSQIRDLMRLRDRERGIIARLRLVIAPIHKLPAELLVEIFLVATKSLVTTKSWSPFDQTERRVVHTLSQVCAYWRRLAHTTPQLWTGYLATTLKKTPSENYLASMKQWLERSSPLPIPVHLHKPIHGKGIDVGPLMDVFISVAHRWKSATFYIPSLSFFSHIPGNVLHTLESLTLASADRKNDARLVTFLNAPRLRLLKLTTRNTALIPMPWSQLTTLTVTDPSPAACLGTLVQCTNVLSATFHTKAWEEIPDASGTVTTLTQLEILNIKFGDLTEPGEHFVPFFVGLALPALRKLDLDLNMKCNLDVCRIHTIPATISQYREAFDFVLPARAERFSDCASAHSLSRGAVLGLLYVMLR
ncbi:hypothetical protein C8R43DRAFT_193380 [Mycena crocata]|nr:hypothetical protein C8R43DRAFT_193380 [Mycena crocata]